MTGDELGEEGDLALDSAVNDNDEDFTAAHEDNLEKEEQEYEKEMDKEDDFGNRRKRRGRRRKRSSYQFEVDVLVENEGAKKMKQAAESMKNLPIFKNDDEKTQFEACLDVDLSQVDNMFRIHIIEQELNEMSGMVYNTPTMSSLSVYSCNVCEKVFKSLSHIRLHCVTHTELKPFKCTKCSYATNSKGNLYTHMRKHTGQYYRCDQCDFKTVNKSHLVEHQMIHTNRRAQCLLCQKDYSTLKSLINHVRKYHTDKKGKEYLQTFLQGRGAKGTTVIHQCHICNRKFKKRIDRDRHLFIHDIKDLPHVQQCELCDYWASRRVYLDKHYLKHRVIYCCTLCDQKFLSTVKLKKHLAEEHSEQGDPDVLFAACINKSLYLPEPLAISQEGSKYVNLPPELRETSTSELSSQTNILKEKTPLSPAVLEKPASLTSDTNPSETQSSHEEKLQLKADPNVASALISSSPPPGNNDVDVRVMDNGTGQAETEAGSMGHVADEKTGIIDGQDVSLNDRTEGSHCDLSDPMKLSLEGLGESSQESKMDLMMMLQNPGSDSDQDGENQGDDSNSKKIKTGLDEEENEAEDTNARGHDDTCDSHDSPMVAAEDNDDMNNSNNSVANDPDGNFASADGSGNNEENPTNNPSLSEQSNVTAVVEESKEKKIQALIQRLGYRQMTTEIFEKMRNTFGHVECEYCGRLFYSKADYEPHLRTHTGDKPFACTNCSFRGNTKEQLRKHCEREHEKVAFQCKECDFLAPTRTRLWNHQLKHLGINGLSCPKCPSKFDGMKQLRAHIINCHKDMDKDALEKLTGYRHKALGKMGKVRMVTRRDT
ncbi:zinc finger protein ZFAT [Elysia marginata]|uniref:Zinc finger protein ZFAT n=1 Tax=Elysia marginata TaxID=1093978 RepID=A0AAV4FNE5_9GAST|nr:zinc finger protein ZFAT [Elysia marginata]